VLVNPSATKTAGGSCQNALRVGQRIPEPGSTVTNQSGDAGAIADLRAMAAPLRASSRGAHARLRLPAPWERSRRDHAASGSFATDNETGSFPWRLWLYSRRRSIGRGTATSSRGRRKAAQAALNCSLGWGVPRAPIPSSSMCINNASRAGPVREVHLAGRCSLGWGVVGFRLRCASSAPRALALFAKLTFEDNGEFEMQPRKVWFHQTPGHRDLGREEADRAISAKRAEPTIAGDDNTTIAKRRSRTSSMLVTRLREVPSQASLRRHPVALRSEPVASSHGRWACHRRETDASR
jgi:hypothetical protein